MLFLQFDILILSISQICLCDVLFGLYILRILVPKCPYSLQGKEQRSIELKAMATLVPHIPRDQSVKRFAKCKYN